MPEKATIRRAQRAKREGKSASTQAGEFVREEMHHIREGEHGAKNAKQAIAIGLSKARRAGVAVKDERGRGAKRKTHIHTPARPSPKRAKASLRRLKREPRRAASHLALSRQAHAAARKKTRAERSAAARKGARTRAKTAG